MVILSFVVLTHKPCFSAEQAAQNDLRKAASVKNKQSNDKKNHKVVVYYFHGNYRCFSCTRIEQMTLIAVGEAFETEIKNGLLEMKTVNVENQKNRHFIEEYQLYTKSVIVSDRAGGKEVRWKNLQRIWELFRNDEVFKTYIQKEIATYLEG
ncbi:MAG: nitrophenyl compound nitroreductase subunit ArsF family protein [Syntrophales bacterium]|nr:nitrophenyl compound nitroreductase subunit ArsF family protein [Syntrophales bacterium]